MYVFAGNASDVFVHNVGTSYVSVKCRRFCTLHTPTVWQPFFR